jgi:hypothetical protein
MILGCKLSGELLCKGGEPNDHEATGAIFVVGGGNGGFRGRELVSKCGMDGIVADQVGLAGTVINARVVSGALGKVGIEHSFLLAEGISFGLPGLSVDTATPAHVRNVLGKDGTRVALIGGGSAEYGQSTDGAIATHLKRQRDIYDTDVLGFKATRFGAVYEGDPLVAQEAGLALPPRLERVSTGAMRKFGWYALGASDIDVVEASGVAMVLHGFEVNPVEALKGPHTLIVPDPEPFYAVAR